MARGQTLDDVGNRTQRVGGAGTHTYVYDGVNRLTSVTYPGPATTTYSFDDFGNRTQMVVGSDTTTYAYDDNARTTTVTSPSPASAISYTWDNSHPAVGSIETAKGNEWDYRCPVVVPKETAVGRTGSSRPTWTV